MREIESKAVLLAYRQRWFMYMQMKKHINPQEYMDCVREHKDKISHSLHAENDIAIMCSCIEMQLSKDFLQRDYIINGFIKLAYDYNVGQASYILFSTEKYFSQLNSTNKLYIDFCKKLLSSNQLQLYFEIESTSKLLELLKNESFDSNAIGDLILIKKLFMLIINNNVERLKTLELIYGNDLSNMLVQYILIDTPHS